ncbi:peptidase A22B, signal peptide peptidase, partial [Aureobasidium melanogenum]
KFKVTLTLRTILSTAVALATIFCSNFVMDTWWLTNLQGFAFSYSALQLMSPTTFGTGSLILSALFFYDIYFVFYTPLMVTVATKLDVPIKLLFPRPLEDGQVAADRKLAMLGLGDIVIPGMMIGLALRFDLHMFYLKRQSKRVKSAQANADKKQENGKSKVDEEVQKEPYRPVTGHWGNKFWTTSWTGRSLLPKYDSKKPTRNPIPTFSKPYFYASIVGYILGMCVTLGIMQVFNHAQPALLYLVPGVLGSLWLTALVRGELKQMWNFTEASDEEEEEEEDEGKKKDKIKKDAEKKDEDKKEPTSWWGKSFFSAEKTERNAKRLEKQIAKSVGGDDKSDSKGKSSDKKEKDSDKAFFRFSFTPAVHKNSSLPSDAKRGASTVETDSATLISGSQTADANGQGPMWRGAGPQETNEERAGKRRRI